MIIKTTTVSDFLGNLKDREVYNKEVFVDSSVNPVNDDGSVSDVTIHASAVLIYPDGAQALLLCGEYCGRDRETGDGGWEGTEKKAKWVAEISMACKEWGLDLKPGILDI